MSKGNYNEEKKTNEVETSNAGGQDRNQAKSGGNNRNNRNRGRYNKKGKGQPIYYENDPTWYFGMEAIALDATNISTFNAAGAKHVSPTFTRPYWTAAGIARFDYIPFFGYFDSPTHAINVAARRTYDVINSKNSRNPSYDPSDLAMYIMAVGQGWSLYELGKRIIGMYNLVNPTNRYWWRDIVASMGFSPISVTNDIVNWRQVLNRLANKLNMLAVPDNIPYFSRARFMNSGIYKDSESEKATYWYYMPAAVMKFTHDPIDQVGRLENVTTPWFSGENVNATQFEAFCNSVIDGLFNDSDIATMSSDIIKALGIEKCFRLPFVDPNYQAPALYSPLVNLQLHNARMAYTLDPSREGVQSYAIEQDMELNCLKSTYTVAADNKLPDRAFYGTDNASNRAILLDFPVDQVGNVDIMEATRLTWYSDYNNVSQQLIHHNMSEVLIRDRVYYYTTNVAGTVWQLDYIQNCFCVGVAESETGTDLVNTAMPRLAVGSKLACAPIIFLMCSREGGSFVSPRYMDIVSDVTNFTTVDKADLANMHDAAIMSLFLPKDWMKAGSDRGNGFKK